MKTCSRCRATKSFDHFTKRAASKDGHTAACTECLNTKKRDDYELEPEKTMERVRRNFKTRREADPIFGRAWEQWRYAKSLGRVPPWVSFSKDLLPRCREILRGKPADWTIDHIVPLQGDIASGLHVPSNLQALPLSDNCSKWKHFHPALLDLHDVL